MSWKRTGCGRRYGTCRAERIQPHAIGQRFELRHGETEPPEFIELRQRLALGEDRFFFLQRRHLRLEFFDFIRVAFVALAEGRNEAKAQLG